MSVGSKIVGDSKEKRLVKRPGSRKSVSAPNLALLGADALSELLMDLAEAQPSLKRRLRLELAEAVGADDFAGELGKRLATIETGKSRVHWRKHKEFVRDLGLQRTMIADRLAVLSAPAAFELLWRLLEMADRVLARANDRDGDVSAVFIQTVTDIGRLAPLAKANPEVLAGQVFEALESDPAGLGEAIVTATLPALGAAGQAKLGELIRAGIARTRKATVRDRRALQRLADAGGDIEGFIALFTDKERAQPLAGAEIARRLIGAGRVDEAVEALMAAVPPAKVPGRPVYGIDTAGLDRQVWEDVYIEAMEAWGRPEEAQALRWNAFERDLSADRLRAFLKRLSGFDDVTAEDKAIAHAVAFEPAGEALRFLIDWPALNEAAALVLARWRLIDVRDVEEIERAVRVLEGRHPLAATLLLRAMVEDIVRHRRSDRYKQAGTYLLEAASLAPMVADFGAVEGHDAFAARMIGTGLI